MTHLHLAPTPTESEIGLSGQTPIRVVLADDHPLIRRSLCSLLDGEEGFEVIAEAGDLRSAVRRVHSQRPDVLVLDLRMPGGSSIEAIRELGERAPGTRVVILTMDDNPTVAQHALAAGALGFVLKEHADHELPQAVRAAARDERYLSPRVASRVDTPQADDGHDELTARERQILRLIALGHTSVEIAAILNISPRTVESHRARIHEKLGLTTRAELVGHALRRGLLTA